jgi:methionyl aminopeptidase
MRGLRKSRKSPALKSAAEIALMRHAGRLVHGVLDRMAGMIAPGITTAELNTVAEALIAEAGAEPLFKGQNHPQAKFPFPAALCISVNAEVVHGIPSDRRLQEGDIVSVDCGVRLDGFCGDSARTFAVGHVAEEDRRLMDVTREALALAIREMRPNHWWAEIAGPMQRLVEGAGFSVIREFVGHGIGRELHEEPKVPNYVDRQAKRSDFLLTPGLVIAVEPMVAAGSADVHYADTTGWPVVTRDGRTAAHYEHTIAVTQKGVDVLTAA